jgi:hypothetical protein
MVGFDVVQSEDGLQDRGRSAGEQRSLVSVTLGQHGAARVDLCGDAYPQFEAHQYGVRGDPRRLASTWEKGMRQ